MLAPRILDSRACGFDIGPTLPRVQDLVATPTAAVDGMELEAADKHDQGPCGHDYDVAVGLIQYEESHPYGTTAYRAGDSGIDVSPRRYRYTGMEQDEETGLGYHTARYYAGWLGRWTASDPIGLGGGVNRFGYVEGRVGGSSDASGLDPGSDLLRRFNPKRVMSDGFGSLFEFNVGGHAVGRDKPSLPERMLGGLAGGVILTATLRQAPTEKHASDMSRAGMRAGSRTVPYLDPLERLVTGTEVDGTRTSRRQAAFDLAVQVGLGWLFGGAPGQPGGRGARGRTAAPPVRGSVPNAAAEPSPTGGVRKVPLEAAPIDEVPAGTAEGGAVAEVEGLTTVESVESLLRTRAAGAEFGKGLAGKSGQFQSIIKEAQSRGLTQTGIAEFIEGGIEGVGKFVSPRVALPNGNLVLLPRMPAPNAPVLVVRPNGSVFSTFADFELQILPNGGARSNIKSIEQSN